MSAQESTIEMYRSIAKNYDFIVKLFGLIGLRTDEYRKLTVDALELSKGDTVVELGCGTGSNFNLLENAVGPDGKIIGVKYLIDHDMMDVPQKHRVSILESTPEVVIPEWVKNNASWWADDLVTDKEFVNAIEWLMDQGVIEI